MSLDFSGVQQALSQVEAQHDTEVAALNAEIAALEAAQPTPTPTPPPPPPASGTQYGINASDRAQHDRALALFGPDPLAWRYYLQPNEGLHYPTEYSLRQGEIFTESGKALPQHLTEPGKRSLTMEDIKKHNILLPQQVTTSMMVTLFRTVPGDREFIYDPWHEAEDDVEKGHFTVAQLKNAYHVCRVAQQTVGNPMIKIACILMGYTWQKSSRRNPEDFIPADEDFDYLFTDTYFAGNIGGPVSGIPTAFDAQIATAKKHGKTWGLTELGIGQKVTGKARNDALTLLARTAREKGAKVALYFMANGHEWDLATGDGSIQAWKAGQQAA